MRSLTPGLTLKTKTATVIRTAANTNRAATHRAQSSRIFHCSFPFRRTDLTFSSTLQFAAKEFNITGQQIRSRSRIQQISLPRAGAIYLAAKNHCKAWPVWAGIEDGPHHHDPAKQRITSLMASDDSLRAAFSH